MGKNQYDILVNTNNLHGRANICAFIDVHKSTNAILISVLPNKTFVNPLNITIEPIINNYWDINVIFLTLLLD